jgi:diacylglycerol kinase family enzyme
VRRRFHFAAAARGIRVKAIVVLNGMAGTLAGASPAAGAARVGAAFARHGVVPEIRLCGAEGCREALLRAIDAAPDRLVVGGGDGTLNAAAQLLAGRDVPLAVLPLGTFNHFAKDLGIPLGLDAAAEVACAGAPRAVDIAEVNGRVFINHSAIGVYPYMVQERERRRARFGHGKWRAMIAAIWRALHDYPLLGFRIRIGPSAMARRSPFVFIANNRYVNESYGLAASSRRETLTLVVAHDTGRLGLLRMGLRSLFGRVGGERALDRFELTSAAIESRRRRLLVGIDGELVELPTPLRYRLLPGALRVVQARAGRSELSAAAAVSENA